MHKDGKSAMNPMKKQYSNDELLGSTMNPYLNNAGWAQHLIGT